MANRTETTFTYYLGRRRVTIKAMDAVGVEDCVENQIQSIIHRYLTGEDLTTPIPRDVKDFILRTNLFV